MVLKHYMNYVIHVNRQHIAFNAKHGKDVLPVYTIKSRRDRGAIYAYAVNIQGPSRMIDPRENDQLGCGARAWMETDGPVEFVDRMSWDEVRTLREEFLGETV